MFQRRHYEFMAATIKGLDILLDDRIQVAKCFARALQDTNPLFDADRFVDACLSTDDRWIKHRPRSRRVA